MQLKSLAFNIEVTAFWYSNNNKLDITKQKSLFTDLIQFKKLKLITQLNSWPVFELTIVDQDWASLSQIKRLDFNIELTKKTRIKFSGVPIIARMDVTEIKWIGYLGDPENIFHTKSEYLSTSWKESVENIGNRFKLEYKHQFDYTNDDGFYIFNETPKSSLLRLLSSTGNDYQFIISFDYFSLVNPNEGFRSSSVEKTNTLQNFILLDNQEKINIIKSESPFSDYIKANEYEVTDENYYRTRDSNKIHHHYQFNGIKSYLYSRSYNENIMSGLKYLENYQLQNILKLPKFVDIDIGQKIQYPRKYSVPNWIVISKEVTLDLTEVGTILKLGNNKKEFV